MILEIVNPISGFTSLSVAAQTELTVNPPATKSITIIPPGSAKGDKGDKGDPGDPGTYPYDYEPENVTNKSTNISLGSSNDLYPTQAAVKAYIDAAISRNTVKRKSITQASTLDTAVDVNDLFFNIAANESRYFEFRIRNACNNTGGIKYAITVPSGAMFNSVAEGTSAGITSRTSTLIFTSGSLSLALFNIVNSTGGWTKIWGYITNGPNAGIVQLQFAAGVAGQTVTVFDASIVKSSKID